MSQEFMRWLGANKIQLQVMEFHKAFDLVVNETPTIVDEKTKQFRKNLIDEEVAELYEAMDKEDLVGIADGLADLLYVVYGMAVSYGINMEPISNEVHRSNMTKVGGHKREDGKWIKPATYEPAQIEPLLREQHATDFGSFEDVID